MCVAGLIALGATSRAGVDRFGNPLGTDFVSFWTASRLALEGHIGTVYEPAAHEAVEQALFPAGNLGYYAFFYPPPFLLICLPLGLVSYSAALIVWLSIGLCGFLFCVYRMLAQRWVILAAIAFPAVWVNITHGQNAFLNSVCFGGFLLLSCRRSLWAGMCLGLMIFKPQLLLAAPFALLAARRWTVIAGAIASSAGLCLLSWQVLGADAWQGFLKNSSLARSTLEQGLVPPEKMQSLFAAVRVLHGGVTLAYISQILFSLAVSIILIRVAARRPGGAGEGALIVMACLLCTPFLLDYDLLLLAFPLVWIVSEARRTQWLPWEKIILFSAYLLPFISRVIAIRVGLPIAPAVMSALLWVVVRRIGQYPRLPATKPFGY
jgi:hypothetical protein